MNLTSTAGRAVLHLRAGQLYTRHSEGSFLRLADNSILYAYSRFTGSADDCAPSDIVALRSRDEGETWSEPEVLLRAADFGSHNIMSVSLLAMQNGDTGLFFVSRQKDDALYHHLARSRDGCRSFHQIAVCSPQDRIAHYVLNNDRVIRLKSGRIVMPLAYFRGGRDIHAPGRLYLDSRGSLCFLLSDDDGKTWHESPDLVHPPFTCARIGLQEPGVLELESGVLWAWARTDKMYQYESFSFDGGKHWTQAQPSRFTSPCSPMHVRRSPFDGTLIAVWNPIPNYNGRTVLPGFGGRTPIVWAKSTDDGKTWSEPAVIEGREDSGYCYPSIFFTDAQTMLVGYCSGGPEEGDCLASSTIRKIQI